MPIQDLARADVVTASPETAAVEVARTMERERVGSVVVVDGDEPVGIVTDRDLAVEVVAAEADPRTVTASDVMAGDLFTVPAEAGIFEVLEEMREAGVRRVPVVDGGEIAGIVTLDDFVVLIASELDDVSGVVQSEAPPY